MKKAAPTAALLVFLAGCGGAADEAARESGREEAAPAVPVATTTSGSPKRAAGRWEMKNIGSGGTVIGTQYLCVDDASEETASLFEQISRRANCSKYEIAPADGAWNFEFICATGGMTSTAKGRLAGNFTTGYKIEMTEDDGTVEIGRIIEARRTGDCPAGEEPGTLTDEHGKVVANIAE